MAYGQSLGITLPTVSVTPGPTYAENINESLQSIIDTLEAKVTPAGIAITSDVDFKPDTTNYGVKNVERVSLQNKSLELSTTTYPGTIYQVNGDLFYNDGSGNSIQITTFGSLGVANGSIASVPAGDYGTNGQLLTWATADIAFKALAPLGTGGYADLWADDIKLTDGSDNFVRVTAPSGMSADTVFTLPVTSMTLPTSAAPTNNSVLAIDTAGVVTASDTITVKSLSTVNAALVGTTLNVGSNLVVGNTISTTGQISAGDTITAAVNKSMVVSGTGRFKYGTQYKYFPANLMQFDGAFFSRTVGYIERTALSTGVAASLYLGIPMIGGERVTTIKLVCKPTSGTHAITLAAYTQTGTVLSSAIGSGLTSSSGTSQQTLSITGVTTTANDGTSAPTVNPFLTVEAVMSDFASLVGDRVYGVEIFYDML